MNWKTRILIGTLVVSLALASGWFVSSWKSEKPGESPTTFDTVDGLPQVQVKSETPALQASVLERTCS